MISITIKNLHKSFNKQVVLNDISFKIEKGELLAVVGPSGTGKSVLLKIITGLLTSDKGEVLIGKDSITSFTNSEEARRKLCEKMGVLFQSAALIDSLTLVENVAFPLYMRLASKEYKRTIKEALRLLDEVNLLKYANSLPGEITIGMRKRAGIARALITKPDVILFDEPNTGLDPEVGQDIYDLIKETHNTYNFTGLVISHEIPEVFQICKRVIMLYGGKVQFDEDVNKFLTVENKIVRQFISGDVDGPIKMAV